MNANKEYFKPQTKMEILSNYYQWYYSLLNKYLGDRIIDLGCGKGMLLNRIHSIQKCSLVVGVDISKYNIDYNLMKNIENAELYCADFATFDFSILTTKNIDTILLLDVLEHMENDVDFLKKIFFHMSKGTRLIIKVPNSQFMFCEIDRASGHYRRYSKDELNRKCETVGLENISFQYMNLVGGLVYLTKKLKKVKNVTFSQNYSDKNLKKINKLIPVFQCIDKVNIFPFGLSILGIYEK